MLIVFTVIFLAGLIIGLVAYNKSRYGGEIALTVALISAFLLIVCLIISLVCVSTLIDGRYLPEKIEMYEEARADVNRKLQEILNDEQSAVSTDTLIIDINQRNKAQLMESYTNYTQKIAELKDDLISLKADRWWLYFGG